MIKIMGIVILIFVMMVLYSLISNKKDVQENKKRANIEGIISAWKLKSLDDVIKEAPTKNHIVNLSIEDNFLSGYTNMSAEQFLTACVRFNIIECQGSGIRYYRELLVVLDKLLMRSIIHQSPNDVVLIFFTLFAFTMIEKLQMPESIEKAADFIRKNGYNIYDSIFEEQRNKWGSILHLNRSAESTDFNPAMQYIFRVKGRLSKNDFLCTNKSAVGPYDEVSINGHKLRFYSKPHLYFIDGIRIISVTQMLKEIDPLYANYEFVKRDVLMRAAARGTALHAEIQKYEEHGT